MSHICRFAAVVFDMDGILIDSEGIWDEVRRGLAAAEGLPWPDEATPAMMGMSTPEWAAYLSETVGLPGTAEEIAERVIDGVAARYAEHLPAIAGGAEAVRRMAEDHVVGVASSSPRRLIDLVIHELGLDGVFTATVSTEEVAAGKPAPDGYLRACELLRVDPGDAVGIGLHQRTGVPAQRGDGGGARTAVVPCADRGGPRARGCDHPQPGRADGGPAHLALTAFGRSAGLGYDGLISTAEAVYIVPSPFRVTAAE